jgi:DNA replication and repair protein RecF
MNRVQLDELTIVNLRNINRAQINPGARFNVVSGHNGMGKTNLIEAVYMLGAMRSFRTAVRRELILHGQEAAKVSGLFGDINAGLKCEITLDQKERSIKVDGKETGTKGNHFQTLPMVLFHPQVMMLVQGGPEARRRFIDRAMFQADSFYPSIYKTYKKIVVNRNRLLRNSNVDRRSLIPFDLQLAETGSHIVKMRRDFIESMKPFFEEAVNIISGGTGRGTIEYRPKIEGDRESFFKLLEDKFKIDCERKYSTSGPHADDIVFLLDGRPARKFASQGQQRTLVLAAKIAETRALSKSTGRIPLLLFDDVSSELDKERNRHLFNFLKGMGGQVFITTTHPDYIDIGGERSDFAVENGSFSIV